MPRTGRRWGVRIPVLPDTHEVWRSSSQWPRSASGRSTRRTTRAVFRYARRRISADLAADTASEVFLVAWRRLPEVPSDPLPWLYAVARRVVANQRRSTARFGRLADRVFANAATASAHEVDGVEETVTSSVAFAAAFNRLSDDDREVLGLVAWEGLGARDAAVVLGCSATAVTMRLHRARRRLRAKLESTAEEN